MEILEGGRNLKTVVGATPSLARLHGHVKMRRVYRERGKQNLSRVVGVRSKMIGRFHDLRIPYG